jgi:nitrite reductase/ring-hydroxylating ferredoxin subunit
VHGSLYTDPAIFDLELQRIWRRTWVYVGHVSEVPQPNDFVMKSIGPEPIIMTRDKQGQVHLLHNRCPHRGNRVCMTEQGQARSFTCPYHGWTFGNDGALRGFPFPSGYEGVDRADLGLGRVARVGIHRGFVFGSMATDGPSLDEHLGAAKGAIDALCLNSPTGEVEITAGFLKHKVRANWKFLVENETDGYHPSFVHASIFEVAQSGIGTLYSSDSTAVSRDFGGGHTENDLRPEFRKRGVPLGWFGTTAGKLPDYVQAMESCLRPDEARRIMIDGTPHIMIWPNLFIAEIQIFVIQPWRWTRRCSTSPRCSSRRARPEPPHAPADHGLGRPGRLPAGRRCRDVRAHTAGRDGQQPRMAVPGPRPPPRAPGRAGLPIGDATDETPSRGIWRHYRAVMEAI